MSGPSAPCTAAPMGVVFRSEVRRLRNRLRVMDLKILAENAAI